MSKIEKLDFFRFLNPIYGAQRTCQPNCCLLSCLQEVKYLYLQFNFLALQGHTLRGRKVRKSKVKCGKNDRKFQNLLEVLKWHENNSAGEFRGENQIHELFSPFDLLSPQMDIEIFISKYRQMTPQSTRNRM